MLIIFVLIIFYYTSLMQGSFNANFLFEKLKLSFFFASILLMFYGQESMAIENLNVDSTNCSIDSALVINPVCNNVCTGSISVYAQGSGPLFYQWPGIAGADSSFVSGLCAGTYTVIITDSTGCIATDSILVEEPLPIAFNLIVTNSSCPGGCTGTVTVIPADTLNYSYQWPGYITTAPTLENICEGTYAVIVTDPLGCTTMGSASVDYDAPFQLNVTSTPATCLSSCDGTATVVANGIPPFTYQWESGPIQTTQSALSLCQGTYKINVTDSTGCVVTDSATIDILPPLAISDTSSMPTCFGGCDGTAQIFVDTTGNYLYEWLTSPSQDSVLATGLCSGWYEVLVTDVSSGCVFSDSVLVTDPPPPLITFSVTPSGCENFCTGTAYVQSSGIPPFTYLWRSGSITASDSALCPGVYAVTVSDSLGCSTTSSVTIESVELLHTSLNTTCNTICDGTAEVWLPSGNWQVSWNTVPEQNTTIATGLCSQSYTVTIEDSSGCIISEDIEVDNDQPVISSITTYPVSCNGSCDGAASVSVSGNFPFQFEWNTSPVQFSDSVSLLCQENYIVTITDSLGCTRMDTVNISGPPAVQFTFNSNTNSCANICDGSAVVFPSLPGSYIYQWQTNPVQYGSSVSNLCSGYTTLEITLGNGCTYL
ncbi:MAG TPA: hypothetical protein PKD91_15535, partial [Bacteroidia bacterium]|nr:hypothetical protein [Bacteroidia bacterium]